MNTATYKIAKQTRGRSHFAVVTIGIDKSRGDNRVVVDPCFSDWLKESHGEKACLWRIDCDYATGAIFGVEYALQNLRRKENLSDDIGIRILTVKSHPCHGDKIDAGYAAAMATWDVLGDPGNLHPYFQDGAICFPGDQAEQEGRAESRKLDPTP